jgi:hypothetical protein
MHVSTCARLFEYIIRTDDPFFLENRWLFRRKTPILPIASSSNTQRTCSMSSQIKKKRVNTSTWRRCINRLKVFYKEFILKISTVTVFLRYVLPSFILFNIRLNELSSSPVTSLSGWREMETKRGHIQLVATCLREWYSVIGHIRIRCRITVPNITAKYCLFTCYFGP